MNNICLKKCDLIRMYGHGISEIYFCYFLDFDIEKLYIVCNNVGELKGLFNSIDELDYLMEQEHFIRLAFSIDTWQTDEPFVD